ncbi:MAG: YqaE/Pmp3 family membrane protein [Anaerolineae bacterium]|nr:YqaE/Pmp3 family membrane protein [Anaerolineae bacterium]
MGCVRGCLCLILPPLAVIDRGCGVVMVVTVLTLLGWIPGVIAALVLNVLADMD